MYPMRYNTAVRILKIFLLNFLFHILWSLTWLWLESRQDTDRSSANGGILRHRQTLVYSLQFYSVSTTVMKSFCKKPLLDVVLKSQVVVRFLRYWSKKGIMYHVLISCHNIVTTQFWHSSLGIRCCHCWRRPQWTGGCKLPCKMWGEDCCAGEEACSWWEVIKDMRRSRSKQVFTLTPNN